MRPCEEFQCSRLPKDVLLQNLERNSPVDLIDASLRSISVSSTVATDMTTSLLDLDNLSNDYGLCYSSRSDDSVRLVGDLFTCIEVFDASVIRTLSKVNVQSHKEGCTSEQGNFEVPEAPHREGAEDKAFEKTCQTEAYSVSFDLKRTISRFIRDQRSKPWRSKAKKAVQTSPPPAHTVTTICCAAEEQQSYTALNEQKILAQEKQMVPVNTNKVDFMFMVPP